MNKTKKFLAVVLALAISISLGSASLVAFADEGDQTTDLRVTDYVEPTTKDITDKVVSVVESLVPEESRDQISKDASNFIGGDDDAENGGKTGMIGILEDIRDFLTKAMKTCTDWIRLIFIRMGIK